MLQQNSNAGELQLNAADLACARELLAAHQESKDPSPMYDFLASKGDRYARLANGVAKGDSIAGAMAIHYLESVAASHNQPMTASQLNNIRYDMAHGYLNTQQKRLDASPQELSMVISIINKQHYFIMMFLGNMNYPPRPGRWIRYLRLSSLKFGLLIGSGC